MDAKKDWPSTRCIDELPEQMKLKFLEMLADTRITYLQISEYLKEQGYDISKYSVGCYSIMLLNQTAKGVDLIEGTENDPGVDI